MKIIFLDIDGVLNTQKQIKKEYMKKHSTCSWEIKLSQLGIWYLKILVLLTKAEIVLSSTWRLNINDFTNLTNQLVKFNMHIFDCTPVMHDYLRGDEIRAWIQHHNVSNFVILDDDSDMCKYTSTNLVKCSWKNGLQFKHLLKALKLLI